MCLHHCELSENLQQNLYRNNKVSNVRIIETFYSKSEQENLLFTFRFVPKKRSNRVIFLFAIVRQTKVRGMGKWNESEQVKKSSFPLCELK